MSCWWNNTACRWGAIASNCRREGEDTLVAAGRELEEETGYRAASLTEVGTFYSSPGMVSEYFTLVRAKGLTKVSEGGGVEGENIIVHRVPLAGLIDFIDSKRAADVAVDVRLLLLLGTTIFGEDLP